ncbi:MAG: hypothetical protein JXB26_17315 [Candidatus Aminicenantes bacterium]|nr:hypothetical protein [Candidatus Aminicenantes bacterium]
MTLKMNKAIIAFFIVLLISAPVISFATALEEKTGPTPAGKRLACYAQHVSMKKNSPFNNMEWRFIGPTIMSGRITDVDIPQGSKYTIYAASASGGLWKSVNEGTTWEPIFEHAASTSLGDIAISPSHPETIYIGLGEANAYRSTYSGTGIYKSTDGGKTWLRMGLGDSHHIGRICIHPRNPDMIYVASLGHQYTFNKERGVFKSINGGNTWKKVLYFDEKTSVIDLVMDPENPEILYASAGERLRRPWHNPVPEFGNPSRGVFKTVDGGNTWEPVNNGLPPLELTGRIGLAVAPTNPNIVYALVDNHNPGRKARPGTTDPYGNPIEYHIKGLEVYHSMDKGETWQKVSPEDRAPERMYSSYGYVFGQIRVDPNQENTIYILGVGLMKSTDGGRSFTSCRYKNLHADHHALWIDPKDSQHLINGNDGGINISYDGGKTWKNIENLGVVQFYNAAVDMSKPYRVCGSIQDNGTYMGPMTHRPERDDVFQWEFVPGGEASYVVFDPTNPDLMYSASFFGRIMRTDLSRKPYRSKPIVPQPGKDEPPLRGNWLAPFILSPHDPNVIYLGMQYVFRSPDQGESWQKISPDLTANNPEEQGDVAHCTITTLTESPMKSGLIYAGTDDGLVHVTRDGGQNWTRITEGLPQKKWVSRLEASAFDEGTVYLSLNGYRDDDFSIYLFKSTDCGTTWSDISGNIPGAPVNVVREDPKNSKVLYVGTDLGVYASTDGGSTWNVLGGNLPTTFVHDLVIHPRDNDLVAATHGRGIWVLKSSDVAAIQKDPSE